MLTVSFFRSEQPEDTYLSLSFGATQDKHVADHHFELLSMQWQLGLRWKEGGSRQNPIKHITPFIKMTPDPKVKEKLGDLWIYPGTAILSLDGSRKRRLPLQPIMLRKSHSYQCDLTSGGSSITFEFSANGDFQNKLGLVVEIILIRNTLSTIERIVVPPCPVLNDFGTLLALNEAESKEKFCDMKVTATHQEEDIAVQSHFYVHKAVLAARSTVFSKMFVHDMQESATNTLNLPDIEPDTLNELLTYIYTGEAPNLEMYAESLLYHAEKYELSHLKALCEEQLSFDLQIDNAAKILQLANTCDAQQLKRNTLLFINKHGDEVQLTEEWEGVKESAELLHDLLTLMYEPAAKRRKLA